MKPCMHAPCTLLTDQRCVHIVSQHDASKSSGPWQVLQLEILRMRCMRMKTLRAAALVAGEERSTSHKLRKDELELPEGTPEEPEDDNDKDLTDSEEDADSEDADEDDADEDDDDEDDDGGAGHLSGGSGAPKGRKRARGGAAKVRAPPAADECAVLWSREVARASVAASISASGERAACGAVWHS